MKLNVKTYTQRDARWGDILLGYNTLAEYNIYNYGCLISSFGNYIDNTPLEVNTVLKNNNGFVPNTGNFIWSKCTVLGLTEVYISPRYQSVDFATVELNKAKTLIRQGYPLISEVDFNPSTNVEDQHYVLLAGVSDNNEIIVVDPWEGQWETWSDNAAKRNMYQFRQYDKKVSISDQTIECDPHWRIERDNNWNLYLEEKEKTDKLTSKLNRIKEIVST